MTDFTIEDFGKDEYQDTLIPVNLLTILMGFAILLFNRGVVFWSDQSRSSSVFCGAFFIIAFMFYLTEYYERLWFPYFSLPNDKMFFRFYGLGIGIVIIALMQNFPEFWYLYVLGLFFWLYLKKRDTRNNFCDAVIAKYNNINNCADKKLKARYYLSKKFTSQFLWYGVMLTLIYSAILMWLYIKGFEWQIESIGIRVRYFTIGNIIVTLVSVAFWAKKVTVELRYMATKVEEGDHEYFKNM